MHGGHSHFAKYEVVVCKYCGSEDVVKYGVRDGVQDYICRACGRKFTAKDAPEGMQTPTEQIGSSLRMFYDGLSLSDVARNLEQTYDNPVNASTVYRWVIRFTLKALNLLEPLKPQVSDTWVADETMVKVAGHSLWFWDVIDEDTRFLLASHLSRTRGIGDVMTVMHRASKRAGKTPKWILSDSLGVYPDGIERIFGADAKHIQSRGFTEDININLIERFHGTLKERIKVLRGFKTEDTADLILDGFLLNYNFFRPHMMLRNKTPAEVAGIKTLIKRWEDVVRHSG